jgi:hypothetical protein
VPCLATSTADILLVVSSILGGAGVFIFTVVVTIVKLRKIKAERIADKLKEAEEQQQKQYIDKHYQVIMNQLNTLTTEVSRLKEEAKSGQELAHQQITELRHIITSIKDNCVRHQQDFQHQEIQRLSKEIDRISGRIEKILDITVKNENYRYDLEAISKNYDSLGQSISDLATLVERLRSKGEL